MASMAWRSLGSRRSCALGQAPAMGLRVWLGEVTLTGLATEPDGPRALLWGPPLLSEAPAGVSPTTTAHLCVPTSWP